MEGHLAFYLERDVFPLEAGGADEGAEQGNAESDAAPPPGAA